MTRSCLLVTGSRSLSDSRASEAWAREQIGAAIAQTQCNLIIHGNAKGPDTWASEYARRLGIIGNAFDLDGNIYAEARTEQIQIFRWLKEPGRCTNPLERNAAMILAAGVERIQGGTVHVLGLIARWTKTHGADHTLRLAEKAGFEVTRLVCPKDIA